MVPCQRDCGSFSRIQSFGFFQKPLGVGNNQDPRWPAGDQLLQCIRRCGMTRFRADALGDGDRSVEPSQQLDFTNLGQTGEHRIVADDDHGLSWRISADRLASASTSSAECPGQAPCFDRTACASHRDSSCRSLRTCSSERTSVAYASTAKASRAAWLRFWKPTPSSTARSSGIVNVTVTTAAYSSWCFPAIENHL